MISVPGESHMIHTHRIRFLIHSQWSPDQPNQLNTSIADGFVFSIFLGEGTTYRT